MLGRNLFLEQLKTGNWTAHQELFGVQQAIDESELKVGPNSVDVTLGSTIYELVNRADDVIDPLDPESVVWATHCIANRPLIIRPGRLYLGIVREAFDCSKPVDGKYYVPMYDGRSTTGRIGLFSHVTAGRGDYGFKEPFTLELGVSHSAPIKLYYRMRIGQVYFQAMDEVGEPMNYNSSGVYGSGRQTPALGTHRFF